MKIKRGLMAAAFVMLAGCNAPAQHVPVETCKADIQMQQTTLYFGLNRPVGAQITGSEWQQFVDQDVTPRFRDGLTVFDARGQWLGNDGKVAREPSKALMLIHGKDAQSEKNIEALRGIYKSRFAQESVMRVDQPVCVQF
ncbi:DUF3574 domain-containing protein [Enterobacter hormaechei]|uniref:DUF3574 domain-containing protein n=1 Tax=Enterobacter hormaechei TaxID=158836 RepID=UPI0039EAACC9